ncbi:MAG TPA: mandelate racemase/muconate lactonizing enzyme family protein [Dehalococcoidia bacterium]|jgi:L-alanine-DL-glutamate epimerase-like enolase superfamily enzyme|nr:mandelate racemase/muconate lactonizing protein [Chloroflexota bacterium]MDP5877738.1 mandelate racemase/muconate lactonizing enzyme family protein [Dehalococcoidia bacterium]MDP7160417.1 mandelate racemase/muconate lactonizing enzyme family protein [Dehalococcoidia bacterium]MDP7212165.1 mandelate racemase/muconate lactonizing enzyme family protein [Dehalococcoidia bacterium]MDP7515336.1 mandelate racemase/muconate lactonizing enzyme family protein [Dehalococcoidia bacterium]|tara:strand:- start:66 stop:1232 length:1167 start_codon:yes stop_codon:yes gene_type:complete
MKITAIENFLVDNGGRGPWLFCAVRTDSGITGYGEYGQGSLYRGLPALIEDLGRSLIGQDPLPVDKIFMDMYRHRRAETGGATAMAMAGIELALWDIKGKHHGVPVYSLVGGPFRDKQRVYWSHLATYRARRAAELGAKPLRTMDDLADCAREAVDAGYTAFKTNIIFPGENPRMINNMFAGSNDQNAPTNLVRHTKTQIGAMRQAVGPDIDILLDINYNFKTEGAIAIGRALEEFDLFWMEIDNQDPDALLQLKTQQRTPICTGEQLLGLRQYQPYFRKHAMDTVKVDVQWQGFSQAKKVAELAEVYELNIAPHNYNSHLSTFQSLNLTAAVSNVRIMESDVDSAPWRDELTTVLPEIKDGYMTIPTGPGWGTELDETAAKKYAFKG